MVQLLWKSIWEFLKKLKIGLPCNPAIPFLVNYPKQLKSGAQIGVSILMSTAELFTVAEICKQILF